MLISVIINMGLLKVFNKFDVPSEVQMIIQTFIIAKPEYDSVLNELKLQYNLGLWWLYKPPIPEVMTSINHIFELEHAPGKVEFMTYDDSMDIVEQAFILEEVNDEIETKVYNKIIKKYT